MDRPPPPPYRRPTLPWERAAQEDFGWARWASVGFEFALIVAVFFLGGRWLDGTLGTDPWLTLTGALLGVAAGMTLLIRAALRGQLPTDQASAPPPPPAPPARGPGPGRPPPAL